jgi:hypothetical protein
MAVMDFLRRRRGRVAARTDETRGGKLAADLWDLLGRGQLYWAGNINVFVGRKAVERHVAKSLRIYPGRTNLAIFMVGDPGREDAYAFELLGVPPDWEAGLYEMGSRKSFRPNSAETPLEPAQWVQANGGLIMVLNTRPPEDCRTGSLEVQVTRRSDGKTALVEFDLDPGAQGAGCYVA